MKACTVYNAADRGPDKDQIIDGTGLQYGKILENPLCIGSNGFQTTPQYNGDAGKSIKPIELFTVPWTPELVQCVGTKLAKLNPSHFHHQSLCP